MNELNFYCDNVRSMSCCVAMRRCRSAGAAGDDGGCEGVEMALTGGCDMRGRDNTKTFAATCQ